MQNQQPLKITGVKQVVVTSHHLTCLKCGESVGTIDHQLENLKVGHVRVVGPWFHNPDVECREGVEAKIERVSESDYNVLTKQAIHQRTWENCSVLIELPPQKHSVFFALRTRCHMDPKTPGVYPDSTYYYNEHTCPVNWLGEVNQVYINAEEDPHGMFRYVRTAPPVTKTDVREKGWFETFPEILDGVPRDECGDIVIPEPEQEPVLIIKRARKPDGE